MIFPPKHIVESEGIRYNYVLFDNATDFNVWTDSENLLLSEKNRTIWESTLQETKWMLRAGDNWFGTPVPASVDELEDHTVFKRMELLQELQPRIRQHLNRYLEHIQAEVLPKPQVAYNDRGLGMFSFERAAMGLFRHSQLQLDTPIEKTATQLNIELGRFDVSTRVKKVFAYFQHKEVSRPSIRLYLLAGGNAGVEGNALFYIGLACAELVEFMEQRGIPVEVNVLLGSSVRKRVVMAVTRVKRFQDKLDKNQLLLLSSDPRYFRFRGFKALISLYNYFEYTTPRGLGTMTESMGDRFVAALGKDGFVFEQSYSLEAAALEVKRIIETYHTNRKNAKAD